MTDKKAILIEFNSWHGECLYSQLLFLTHGGYEVALICDTSHRRQFEHLQYDHLDKHFINFKRAGSILKCYLWVINSHINRVIFNTAQGSATLKFLLLPFPRRIKFAGIIHNVKKIETSRGQHIISRKVTHYFLLSDYLESHFPKEGGLKCCSVEFGIIPPLRFASLQKEKDVCYVAIPGYVEYKRRDYLSILPFLDKWNERLNLKIVLLGNIHKSDGPDLWARIKRAGLERQFITFDHYIDEEDFCSYIQECDFILPLIHPGTPDAMSYTNSKISGSFTLSKMFGKTMLCHRIFQNVENFNYDALYYESLDELPSIIEQDRRRQTRNRFPVNLQEEGKKYINFLEKE